MTNKEKIVKLLNKERKHSEYTRKLLRVVERLLEKDPQAQYDSNPDDDPPPPPGEDSGD